MLDMATLSTATPSIATLNTATLSTATLSTATLSTANARRCRGASGDLRRRGARRAATQPRPRAFSR